MKGKKRNFLISVTKNGLVTALHWSHNLVELATIKLMHPGSKVDIMKVDESYETCLEVTPEDQAKKPKLLRNGKPVPNRVLCVDTGEVFDSVADCADKMGVPRVSIYKSIRCDSMAYGHRFVFLPPKPKKEK